MYIQRLNDKQIIDILEQSAKIYEEYAESELLFIYRRSKNEKYSFYETTYKKRNFMHLAGIRSKTLSAETFFEKCIRREIVINECTPSHDVVTRNKKINVLKSVLNLSNSKCYRIGEKNLITKDNDFEMAIGNYDGVVGYSKRKNNSEKINAIPTTLLANAITYYCSQPNKIMFILKKNLKLITYEELFFEISNGLFRSELNKFPNELLKLINIKTCVQ